MSVRLPQKAFHAFCGVAAFPKVWSKLRLWLIARTFSVAQEAHNLSILIVVQTNIYTIFPKISSTLILAWKLPILLVIIFFLHYALKIFNAF